MTCIVGVVDKENKCVWLGSDSLGSSWQSEMVILNKKVVKHYLNKSVAFGLAGSYRTINMLTYDDTCFPELDFYKSQGIDEKYLIKTFIPNFQKLIKSGEIDGSDYPYPHMLLAIKDKLFTIQSDFSVIEQACGYDTEGTGGMVALGSLYSTEGLDLTIPKRIELALLAAQEHCPGVRGPFYIINTMNEEEIKIEK